MFIGEYVCGGGFVRSPLESVPAQLKQEGLAMLSALVEDFSRIATEVHVAVDDRFTLPSFNNVEIHPVRPDQPLWPQWMAAARLADRSLIVAPETEGVLAQSVAMLSAAGVTLLNGYGDFLRCASDKLETARVFSVAGVPHPTTWTHETLPEANRLRARRWVVKPRDGCGAEGIELHPTLESARLATVGTTHIIQPWIEGRPVSIAAIVEGQDISVLPAVQQHFFHDGSAYRGGTGPLPETDQQRATHLIRLAIDALPRTIRGYVGFDMILADDPQQDCVIEVNPRVTTSYVGLRQIVEGNLAARIAGLEKGPVRCAVDTGRVSWNSSGEVWFNE
jgi:predicted ATP-grasp superfamily ATP-dependent carboligase